MSSETLFEAPPPPPKADRSITALLTSLVNETGLLVRQEMALFRTEMSEAVGRASLGAAVIAAGGIFALGGFLALLAAAAVGLTNLLPPGLAALVIGVFALLVAAILVLIGKSRLKAEALTPHRTLHSLREDRIWIKEQVR